jgi:hypothetical protein
MQVAMVRGGGSRSLRTAKSWCKFSLLIDPQWLLQKKGKVHLCCWIVDAYSSFERVDDYKQLAC